MIRPSIQRETEDRLFGLFVNFAKLLKSIKVNIEVNRVQNFQSFSNINLDILSLFQAIYRLF